MHPAAVSPGEGSVQLKCEASVIRVMHQVPITEMLLAVVLAKSAV